MNAIRFMLPRRFRRWVCALSFGAALPGCGTTAYYDRSELPKDFQVPVKPAAAPTSRGQINPNDASTVTPVSWVKPGESVVPAGAQVPAPPAKGGEPPKPLDVPPSLPGAEIPRIALPPDTPATRTERLKVIDALFPELPPLPADPIIDGLPGARVVTLEELLDFAMKNSPDLAQATADVADTHGRWVQAGLYPNPTVGFQGDQIFDLGPFGQFGGFFNQTVVTGGKLKIARSVAFFDYLNARVQLRKVEVELTRRVRSNYYATLVAAENVRVGRLIVAFTDEVYRRQVALVKGGTAAPYEAAALLAITSSAESTLLQSRNRHISAWKQLAAAINSPNLPPAPLAGKVDESLPHYGYDALREQMLATHTDLMVAKNNIVQAERAILREQRKIVPDIQNQMYFEQDTLARAQGMPNFQMGAQIGVTVPLFNRNQGGIMSAKALFARASAEVPRVQNILIQQFTDVYERYETARQQTKLYRERILPNLVTAFRGVYQRYQVEPDKVNYNDIVTAQQNLVMQLAGYLQALQMQWQVQADLAGSVQAIDPKDLPQIPEPAASDTWPESSPRIPLPKKP